MKNLLLLGSAAVLLLASPVWASWPFDPGYGGYGGCSTCGSDCWAQPGCCERPISKYDHIWDSYCQEKWCPHTDAAYLRCWWHAAPASTGYAPAHGYADSCGSTLEAASGPVNYARPVSTQRRPTFAGPRTSDPPPAPKPPELQGAPPSQTPPGEGSLQLKLLPLSRPRASQP